MATFSKNITSLDHEIVQGMKSLLVSENNTEYDEIVNLIRASCGGERGIPGDLLVQILLKLPIKSLIRFKVVCKSWKLLIDSSVFMDNHPYGKIPHEGLFTILDFNQPLEKEYNPFPFGIDCSLGTCNGIICFKTDQPNPLVLCNLSTREFSFLRIDREAYYYGFCYDSQTQEYKVICITLRRRRCYAVDIAIFTLGTKSLREVKRVTLPGQIDTLQSEAVCETCMAWLGYDDDGDDIVICYDVFEFEDRFTKINMPLYDEPMLYNSLGVLKNSVIMFLYSGDDATYFDIWILIKESDSKARSWMKYRRVEPRVMIYPIHVSWDEKWVICTKRFGSMFYHKSSDLLYYDLEANQVLDYKKEAEDPQVVITSFVNYVKSPISPNSICSMNI